MEGSGDVAVIRSSRIVSLHAEIACLVLSIELLARAPVLTYSNHYYCFSFVFCFFVFCFLFLFLFLFIFYVRILFFGCFFFPLDFTRCLAHGHPSLPCPCSALGLPLSLSLSFFFFVDRRFTFEA
ncbi:hypothetical protein DFH27DRAFT_230410 [Peziza echinospora]|nr:hypothetical protein DFH27DRAFT_230410 [Peziza echinospora]